MAYTTAQTSHFKGEKRFAKPLLSPLFKQVWLLSKAHVASRSLGVTFVFECCNSYLPERPFQRILVPLSQTSTRKGLPAHCSQTYLIRQPSFSSQDFFFCQCRCFY